MRELQAAMVASTEEDVVGIKTPGPIDQHVGSRIRSRRRAMGFTQTRLGDSLGLTFQQVQKYEKGTNRVGASRLHQIAEILDVSVGYFYDGEAASRMSAASSTDRDGSDELEAGLLAAFARIADPELRRFAVETVRAIAAGEAEPAEATGV